MSILHHSSEQSEPVAISPSNGAADHNPIATQMAVFYTDLQGEFGACNSAFSQLFGYSPQELIGREFCALFAPADKLSGGSRDQ